MRSSRVALAALMAVTILALGAGCGGGKKASTTTSGPTAQQQIRQTWTSFFSGKTAPEDKLKLLQNGERFSSLVKVADANPLAKQTSATVSKVTLQGPSKASVVYTVDIAGKPVLKNRTGVAVKENGVWKVGDQSFCALVSLEGTKTAACPGS